MPFYNRPSTIDHRPSTIDHRPSNIKYLCLFFCLCCLVFANDSWNPFLLKNEKITFQTYNQIVEELNYQLDRRQPIITNCTTASKISQGSVLTKDTYQNLLTNLELLVANSPAANQTYTNLSIPKSSDVRKGRSIEANEFQNIRQVISVAKPEKIIKHFQAIGGEEIFIVPVDGTYTFTIASATGGNSEGNLGFLGKEFSGSIALTKGDRLRINVGKRGNDSSGRTGGGGGWGGTIAGENWSGNKGGTGGYGSRQGHGKGGAGGGGGTYPHNGGDGGNANSDGGYGGGGGGGGGGGIGGGRNTTNPTKDNHQDDGYVELEW